MILPPTRMQRKAERFIEAYRRDNDGVSPTYAEIAEALGIDVRNAYGLVTGLVERGRATRTRAVRSIQLLTNESTAA
jgi:DNA-binding IclR family transcriptional regulator